MYDGEDKSRARLLVGRVAAYERAASILDLWGGGASARLFRLEVPDAVVTTAEKDESLWAAMRLDAFQHGYAPFFGDVCDVEGRFDFIWLDACGQVSPALKRLLERVAKKRPTTLFVTLMPARENESWMKEMRLTAIPLWLEHVTNMRVRLLWPYKRPNGLPMWLVGLGPRPDRDAVLIHRLRMDLAFEASRFSTEVPAASPWSLDLPTAPFARVSQYLAKWGIWAEADWLIHAVEPVWGVEMELD